MVVAIVACMLMVHPVMVVIGRRVLVILRRPTSPRMLEILLCHHTLLRMAVWRVPSAVVVMVLGGAHGFLLQQYSGVLSDM